VVYEVFILSTLNIYLFKVSIAKKGRGEEKKEEEEEEEKKQDFSFGYTLP
jgi:hypothetical protein